ncbi:S8 family serine peptidase [uncultured Chitinophaga sp.]|uniref:S8 family serine peptidase n=1 Tax=uncultured Chitinophaga sp. TaxID=339340 RepID=UPI0025FF9BBF|nr:S8 family serine peptidase [uncultured Chitinophaga sp.]
MAARNSSIRAAKKQEQSPKKKPKVKGHSANFYGRRMKTGNSKAGKGVQFIRVRAKPFVNTIPVKDRDDAIVILNTVKQIRRQAYHPAVTLGKVNEFIGQQYPHLLGYRLGLLTPASVNLVLMVLQNVVQPQGGMQTARRESVERALKAVKAAQERRLAKVNAPVKEYIHVAEVEPVVDEQQRPIFTGSHLVLMDRSTSTTKMKKAARRVGVNLKTIYEFTRKGKRTPATIAIQKADGVIFPRCRLVIFRKGQAPIIEKLINQTEFFRYGEPARYNEALADNTTSKPVPPFADGGNVTWGNIATNVVGTHLSGKGIRVAILDTGIDNTHPLFAGRIIEKESFIDGEDYVDTNGHGTKVAAIAAGGSEMVGGRRIGVAYEADLYCGKVLPKAGPGKDEPVIDGIEWALSKKCHIVNLSLSRLPFAHEKQPFSQAFEDVAQMSLVNQCLIVAAAGNFADRDNGIKVGVGAPANSPSIMAVSAVDQDFKMYKKACSQVPANGHPVNITGPGVNILTANIVNKGVVASSGTSLASPYVAGIAALYWQEDLNQKASEIWAKLEKNADPLPHPATEVGAGLVYLRTKT